MNVNRTAPKTIAEYVANYPNEVQEKLEKVRATIRKAAPAAEETISYRIPAFTLNGKDLIYFAAYKKHIGVYPAPLDNPELKDELAVYASGKGTVKFPLDEPLPYGLITKIVKVRIKENLASTAAKNKQR